MIHILAVYLGFYLLWICIVHILTKKSLSQEFRAMLWKKCWTYFVITISVFISIYFFKYILLLIVLIGLLEVIVAYRQSKTNKQYLLWSSLMIYVILSLLFGLFVFRTDVYELLHIYLLVAVFDASSQLFGLLFGKKKIVSKISPNKTWAGTILGLFSGTVAYCCFQDVSLTLVFFGLMLSISAFLGDIVASIYKRKLGVKDFGNLLPTHGGVLDRFDSFIGAGIFYILISII